MDAESAASPQHKAYEALNKHFCDHEDEVLEIAILPPGFAPPNGIFMTEERNVGLPKEILALAFLEACKRFLTNKASDAHPEPALQATRLIILFDPEYLTAVNFRKRRLLHLQSLSPGSNQYNQALYRELTFITSILTSPLHRQTKSPTLWWHRFWLIKHHLRRFGSVEDVQQFLRSELGVVCKSGERHPKNYYAFQYARRLFALFDLESTPVSASVISARAENLEVVRSWCCRNSSDISGLSFLTWLLRRCEDKEECRRVVGRVMDYVLVMRVTNESLWVFVRLVVSDVTVAGGKTGVLEPLKEWLTKWASAADNDNHPLGGVVRDTVEWAERGCPVHVADKSK